MPSQVLETGGSAGKLQEVFSGCIYWDTSDDSKNTTIGALVTSVRCLQSVTVSCVPTLHHPGLNGPAVFILSSFLICSVNYYSYPVPKVGR